MMDIKKLSPRKLKALNQKMKMFNVQFDKLNSLYYDKDYYHDEELKQLFTSICRQAHRIENISRKYLLQMQSAISAPGYIKEGLAKLSQETLIKSLPSEA